MSQIKIYISLFTIAVVSFGFAFYAPIAEIFKGIVVMPAVGAMFAAIFQLVRDDAAHVRKKEILIKEQHYSLAASSHMANVVFDKQVEFSDKYASEALNAFHTLMPKQDWQEAHSFAKNLTFIRLEYMCWLTTEIDENLEEFENKLRTLGANSSYIKMPKGEGTIQDHRDEAAREMLEIQAAFLYILEKTDKHPEVRLSSLSKKMRKMLNVEDLTTLKNKLVESSLQSNS
ncbi:hypothetical protein C9J21_19250 [Photobacterium phosphoreum]|uniref:hypothetical protein n=1 Tax=Photobacterium phosphoreum TaxID=659 RepID=UPI000D15B381|nr:hypothetical protein [Photobacterium phosphoreum]PSU75037.1 hypothetical protein CTM67_16980 [Photobacterium phosphoreum]PSW29983.1 hypothetical protein C9J21_19250 [Photobacterium phosphoreum]